MTYGFHFFERWSRRGTLGTTVSHWLLSSFYRRNNIREKWLITYHCFLMTMPQFMVEIFWSKWKTTLRLDTLVNTLTYSTMSCKLFKVHFLRARTELIRLLFSYSPTAKLSGCSYRTQARIDSDADIEWRKTRDVLSHKVDYLGLRVVILRWRPSIDPSTYFPRKLRKNTAFENHTSPSRTSSVY